MPTLGDVLRAAQVEVNGKAVVLQMLRRLEDDGWVIACQLSYELVILAKSLFASLGVEPAYMRPRIACQRRSSVGTGAAPTHQANALLLAPFPFPLRAVTRLLELIIGE